MKLFTKHLRMYERGLPLRQRMSRWHWYRVAHDRGPILWTLAWVWWIPGLRWLQQMRHRNISWRLERRITRVVRHCKAKLYDWSREP
jgi:hypothetical protein